MFAGRSEASAIFFKTLLGRGHIKETGNCNETVIPENHCRLQAGNWFPEYRAQTEETDV
jgi:hypothetical protein